MLNRLKKSVYSCLICLSMICSNLPQVDVYANDEVPVETTDTQTTDVPETPAEPEPVEPEQPEQPVTPEEPEKQEASQEEPVKEEEKEDSDQESVPNTRTVYEASGSNVNVTVTLSDPEAIPDDALLHVEEVITEAPEQLVYNVYFTGIPEDENNKKVGETPVKLDLESGTAEVSIRFGNTQLHSAIKAHEDSDIVVYQISNGETQLTNVSSIEAETVTFTATSLNQFKIVNSNYKDEEQKKEEENTRTQYSASSDGVQVTAVLEDANAIPDDAELTVSKVGESERVIVYDISFMGPEKDEDGQETGNTIEYEPTNGSVNVSMDFQNNQLSEQLGIEKADELVVMHAPDNGGVETVDAQVSLKKEVISFELTSFSKVIVGKSTDDPNPFKAPEDKDTFLENGGTYDVGSTLQYLFEHFQIVTKGNTVLDKHCMGSILVGGDLKGKGTGFADALNSAEQVSSFIQGSVADFEGTSGSRCGGHNLSPLYLGSSNVIEGKEGTPWESYYVNGTVRYNQTDSTGQAGNPIYTADNYVDWDKLYDTIKKESEMLQKQGATGRPTVSDEGRTLTVTAGQYITIESLQGVETINIVGDSSVAQNTIINVLDGGDVKMPTLLINGKQADVSEEGSGTALVWNFPNATHVQLPTLNWMGHVVAPDAKIEQQDGNYNGALIGKEVKTSGEGHKYWYNGGKLISDDVGFFAKKSFRSGIWPDGLEFKVHMEARDGAPALPNPVITLSKDNQTASFGDITFTPPQDLEEEEQHVFYYDVFEENDGQPGVSYDDTRYTAEVHVTYKKDGEDRKAEVTEINILKNGVSSGSITVGKAYTFGFENEYDDSVKGHFETTKAVSGNYSWGDEDSFEFTLTPAFEGEPMPENTTAIATKSNPTAVFNDITFKQKGTYTYYIQEVEPEDKVPGVTYDTSRHTAHITIGEENGRLAITRITYDGSNPSLTITNTYKAEGQGEVKVQKVLDGREWTNDDKFTFTISAKEGTPMPAEDRIEITNADEDYIKSFGTIKFDEPGTYTYTVKETKGNSGGITYDETEHTVTIEVVDNGRGQLVAKKGSNLIQTEKFTNKYKAEGEGEVKVQKVLNGREWADDDKFTFTISAEEGTPLPAQKSIDITKADKDQIKSFGTIEFKKAGSYTYTVKETKGSLDGITYDEEEHTVTIEVVDNGKGQLVAKEGSNLIQTEKITNTFAGTKATIEATKEFNDWGKAKSFTFNLAAVTKDAPMPENTSAQATEKQPLASFGEIEYKKAGTYTYTITEVNDGVPGVTYDTQEHTVEVVVTKDEKTNQLSAEVKYDEKESLTITNTFTSTSATIKATKSINDWGAADSFTFNLAAVTKDAPMPEETSATATKDAPDAVFGEITYDKVGTYEYTITEVDDGVDGVTYDTKPHSVIVEVTKADDATNKLVAKVTYEGEDSLTIVNSYASTKATLQATKAFEDWGKADSFTFEMVPVDNAPMPKDAGKKVTKTVTKDAPTAVFGEIEYKKAGEYKYTITEINDGKDGVTYDTTPHEAIVKVVKGEGNKLTTSVTYDGQQSLTITNTYASTKATIEATKDFNDWGKADSFTFDLAAVTKDAPMPANKSATATKDAPKAVFGDIEFEKAGTYEYTITERNGGADGVTYDTTPHKVVVTVTKEDKTNKLSASVKYDDADSLTITNTYKSTSATIETTKEFNDWGKADSFTFDLAAVTENAPMPAKTIAKATKDAPKAVFGEIKYEKTGTYEYTITERNGGADGVTYDTTPHKVIVTVTKDEKTNQLSATVKYDDKDSLTITNTYASTKATIEATKEFNDWGKADKFTFNLEAVTEDAPMPAKTSADATKEAPTASFKDIEFEKAGTYEYTITEVNDHVDGVTYDTAKHRVVVTVTKDNKTNQLQAKVTYDDKDSLTITNTFKATQANIKATKQFNDWGKADKFTFNLEAKNGAPLPANTTAEATKDAPEAVFGNVSFDKAGTYEYTITEVDDGMDGVTYDTTAHNVVIMVTKDPDTNELSATVKYDNKDSLIITNSYESSKANLQATKAFDDWGKADSFTFNLKAIGNAPLPETTTAKATEENTTAVFGEVVYEKAGTYEYTITEVDDGVDGVTYDTTPHKVVVTVTKGKDNKLSASVKYDGKDSLIITNRYESTKATIEATKDFKDWGKADQFTFNLEAIGNAPMPAQTSATVTKDEPKAVFGEIEYEKAGTYEYTITEVDDGADGVTYDTTPHKVVVTVTKGKNNKLSASVKYDDADSLTITNTYAATNAEIDVTKEFEDWGAADSFTFNLEAVTKDAPMPEKPSAEATEKQPTASFGKITYEKAGTYEYTITEQNGGVDGVTYDTTPHKVVVTVTKGKGNKLHAKVKYDGEEKLIVTNTYETTKAKIEATKQFNDWGKAKSFTFNLEAVTKDAPMPEKTSAQATEKQPLASFGEIEYKKAGTYEYTITEVNDGVDGVTYDTTPHSVIVTVTKADDATNALHAEVKYDGAESLTITNTFEATSATIEASKSINDWGAAESFTFNLAAVTKDAPMPEKKSAEATEKQPTASFGKITYEKAGTYEYTITEVDDGVDGVTYDTTPHKVVVTVKKDKDNKLSASVAYDGQEALVITNKYESSKATLQATKAFNDWGKAKSFTFNLAAVTKDAPMPEKISVKATEKQPTASFGEIEYKKAGTYEYTITEVNDGVDGVTYDTTPHKVVVKVTKGKGNKLETSVTYDNQDALIITNTYKATQASIKAKKEFNDWGKADSFTFHLEAVGDAPLPENTIGVATQSKPTVTFGDITYEKAGTYEYTVTEVNDHVDGVTYDTKAHKVTVKVTKAEDATNELKAEVTYEDGKEVIISNTFTDVKIIPTVTKEIAGRDWEGPDSFTFELSAVTENAPMPDQTKAVAVGPRAASFGEIAYDKAGTYKYEIAEVNNGAGGFTYDPRKYEMIVTVTKDANTNALSAVVDYDGNDVLIVTNKYEATGEVTFHGTKELTGRSSRFPLRAGEFEFEVIDEEGKTVMKTTNDADGNIPFETIKYVKNKDQDDTGTHTYTVKETTKDGKGVKVDVTEYTVQVKVTDNKHGKLIIEKTDNADKLGFANTYEASGETELEAEKILENKKLQEGDYTFELSGAGIETQTKTNDADGHVQFDKITYNKEGTYFYTIKEIDDGKGGVTYDDQKVRVTVVVTDNGDGTMSVAKDYDGANTAVFTNTYDAQGKTQIEGKKTLKGRELKDGEFEFTLSDEEGNVLQTVSNKGETFSFEPIEYELSDLDKDEDGYAKETKFKYTVKETAGKRGGVTYDETEYEITVTVSDNGDGTLNVVKSEEADSIVFTNEYKTESVEVKAAARKIMNGKSLKAGEFEFTMEDEDGHLIKKTNGADGSISFGTFKYNKEGTYTYTVKEVKGTNKLITYDTSVYRMTVKVSDDQNGKLKAETSYTKDGRPADGIVFTNTYSTKTRTGAHTNVEYYGSAAGASLLGAWYVLNKKRKKEEEK